MSSIIGLLDATYIDTLFSSTTNSQTQLDSLATSALSAGIDLYTKEDYVGAAREFKRSLLLSPNSTNSADAYNYLAQSYLKQGKTDEAIKIYKQAINANLTDDTFHLSLGDVYYKTGRNQEAISEYTKAVQLDPTSPDNHYSLGQSYLSANLTEKAKAQFLKVTQLAPTSPTGFYGMAQAYRQSGKYSDALNQLNKALTLNKKFANAYLELGYTYMDMGDQTSAQEQVTVLQGLSASSQVTSLQTYITQTASPKITMAYSTDGFSTYSGPGTLLSSLDSSLFIAGAGKEFTMNFMFSKAMNSTSVESLANWQISRQSGNLISDEYNYGMPIPSSEVTLPFQPTSVSFDEQSNTATITFTLLQNATASGTIDPSHISFKFTGKDTYGKTMDPAADEYSGFSTVI